jgi:S-adenosylmethionine/arginine decarboxylase-like enzyme
MAVVHKHLIIRAEVNNTPTDPSWLHNWLRSLVDKIGMKICQGPITHYVDMVGNAGLTGVVIIETSHIAVHVWDEQSPGLMQLDVYTCGPFNPQDIFDLMQEFDPVKLEYKYLDRERGLTEVEV